MDGLENSTAGVISTAASTLADQVTWQNARITAEQERIDQMEEGLIARMAEADALIAELEQKVTYITGLFSAMQSLRDNMQ